MQEAGSFAAEVAGLWGKRKQKVEDNVFLLHVAGKPSEELSKNQLTCQNSTKRALTFSIFTGVFPLDCSFHLLLPSPANWQNPEEILKILEMQPLCAENMWTGAGRGERSCKEHSVKLSRVVLNLPDWQFFLQGFPNLVVWENTTESIKTQRCSSAPGLLN